LKLYCSNCVRDVLNVLLGRNFVSNLPTLKPKNLKKPLKTIFLNLGFYQPWVLLSVAVTIVDVMFPECLSRFYIVHNVLISQLCTIAFTFLLTLAAESARFAWFVALVSRTAASKWNLHRTDEKACLSHLNGLFPIYQPMYCTVTVILQKLKIILPKRVPKCEKCTFFNVQFKKEKQWARSNPILKTGYLPVPDLTRIYPLRNPWHRLWMV